MRVLFMGTPDFAVPSLEALVRSGHSMIGVVTQPDRPKGRKQVLESPPVKRVALKYQIPLYQPNKVKTPEFIEVVRSLDPDLIVVVAFGQLLSKALLSIPKQGCLNVHASLLPKYRGAAPIQWAIIRGETVTGATTMLLDEGMDTGPMLKSVSLPISGEDTTATLSARLAESGARLLISTMEEMEKGLIRPVPQDSTQATYAPIIRKENGRVDWSESAEAIERKNRALTSWPGMFTYHHKRLLKLLKLRVGDTTRVGQPGEILGLKNGRLRVATGTGTLEILEVQPENGKRMSVTQYAAGHPIKSGDQLADGQN